MDKNTNTMMVVFIAGILLIAVILVLNQGQTIVGPSEERNTISVTGNSQIEVDPDQVELLLAVETFSKNAQHAKDENAKMSDKVIKALDEEGIMDENIETASFSINPRYKYDREKGESVLQGYEARNTIKVTTKQIEKAGTLIDAAVDAGANNVDSVNFGLSDEKKKEVSSEALVRAAEVARDKAESLTSTLGVNLGRVVSIQESNFDYIPFAYGAREEVMQAAKDGALTQIVPGKVEVNARVTLDYRI